MPDWKGEGAICIQFHRFLIKNRVLPAPSVPRAFSINTRSMESEDEDDMQQDYGAVDVHQV